MNTSKLNEINAADANARYVARGVPAFICHFVSKDRLKVAVICRKKRQSGKTRGLPPLVGQLGIY
jgi:hypothetical protein